MRYFIPFLFSAVHAVNEDETDIIDPFDLMAQQVSAVAEAPVYFEFLEELESRSYDDVAEMMQGISMSHGSGSFDDIGMGDDIPAVIPEESDDASNTE